VQSSWAKHAARIKQKSGIEENIQQGLQHSVALERVEAVSKSGNPLPKSERSSRPSALKAQELIFFQQSATEAGRRECCIWEKLGGARTSNQKRTSSIVVSRGTKSVQ
jgi:hypothetical protein